jgi:hypothetical protein
MLWFKHHNNFRNSPSMKWIKKRLGDAGVAAAYRLLEVICERCGTGEEFNPVLTLQGATSKMWLAEEILTPENGDSYSDGFVTEEQLDGFLAVCERSGLVERTTWEGDGSTWDDDKGVWVPGKVVLEQINIPSMFNLLDEHTARERGYKKKKNFKGLATPK